MQDLFFLKMHGFMEFNHIKKNYSGKTGIVFKIAGKIPLPPVPGGLKKTDRSGTLFASKPKQSDSVLFR